MRKEPKELTFDEFADELLKEKQPRALVILAAAKIDTQLRALHRQMNETLETMALAIATFARTLPRMALFARLMQRMCGI